MDRGQQTRKPRNFVPICQRGKQHAMIRTISRKSPPPPQLSRKPAEDAIKNKRAGIWVGNENPPLFLVSPPFPPTSLTHVPLFSNTKKGRLASLARNFRAPYPSTYPNRNLASSRLKGWWSSSNKLEAFCLDLNICTGTVDSRRKKYAHTSFHRKTSEGFFFSGLPFYNQIKTSSKNVRILARKCRKQWGSLQRSLLVTSRRRKWRFSRRSSWRFSLEQARRDKYGSSKGSSRDSHS
jgi:hypothetical protein